LQLCADGGYQLRIRSLEGTPNYGPRQRSKRYLEDQQISSISPRLMTKRSQGKSLKNTRKGQPTTALVAHRTVQFEAIGLSSVHRTTYAESSANGLS
jgi:hypothetical protein